MKLTFDENILIGLKEGKILDFIYSFNATLIISDFQIEKINVGRTLNSAELIRGGFQVIKFDPDEIKEISTIVSATKGRISIDDIGAYMASCKTDSILLTGDKNLRKYSEENHKEVHGILWLIDKMYVDGIITNIQACSALKEIKMNNNFLPISELNKRLDRYCH